MVLSLQRLARAQFKEDAQVEIGFVIVANDGKTTKEFGVIPYDDRMPGLELRDEYPEGETKG